MLLESIDQLISGLFSERSSGADGKLAFTSPQASCLVAGVATLFQPP